MNQHEQNSNQLNSTKLKSVPLNIPDFIDDFNIDETSFKPVTKGLGFHQEVKQKQFTPANVMATKLQNETTKTKNVAKYIASSIDDKKRGDTQTQAISNKGALAAFYGNTAVLENIEVKDNENLKASVFKSEATAKRLEASSYAQFIAYMIDVLLVLSFTIATIAALVLVSRIDYAILLKAISIQDQVIFGSSLFIIYYLLYFTVLDMNASPGKAVMNIRLYTANGKNVGTKHTFMRALITLLSVAALTLPTLLDFQGRLSGSKVFKDN